MNREELIRSLRELAQELGKDTLTQKDIKDSEISVYWVRKHFRNMAFAMEAAGLQPSRLARSMVTSDDELLDYLDDLQRRLGRRPIELDIDKEGRFSHGIFSSRFGSLDGALAQLKERGVPVEEHPRVQPRSREELVRRLQEIAQQHGDKPLREKDIKAYGLSPYWIRKHFMNLGSALEAAGLRPSKLARSMATSDEELLDYLDDLQRRLGQRPTYLDIDREGRFSQRIFFSRFGSLDGALVQLKERGVPVEEHPRVQPRSREELRFVHTSPYFAGSEYGARVTSIRETIVEMLQRVERSIRISTLRIDILADELIRLKHHNPDLEITVLTRGRSDIKGERSGIGRRAFDRMMGAGITVLTEKELLHSRMVVIDEQEVLVSSADLDVTQMDLEFNAGIWTNDPDVVAEAIRYFDNLLKL
jgi:hypothetical protein